MRWVGTSAGGEPARRQAHVVATGQAAHRGDRATHTTAPSSMNAALARYDDALWETLGALYEASRDAAASFDKTGDELFQGVVPAQMLIAEEAAMVLAGGPTL